jgi:hypothetical protein
LLALKTSFINQRIIGVLPVPPKLKLPTTKVETENLLEPNHPKSKALFRK